MSASGTFRIVLTQQIAPGREREFEETWLQVAPDAAKQPENLGAWLVRSTDDPSTYYIFGEWANEQAYQEFQRNPEHLGHRKRLHALRTSFSAAAGTVVAHLPGAGAREYAEQAG
ncbi:antibiotic biosynthesis monooxygenase family protein [Frankia sp. CiP1_Cm_nod2]|uniref:antibiotic biosynthesis monooxygenase family protein n=1 Tax=Frankia sp. CiP1_Cm_nod2 TaxID=2897161 RepID=UPI00202410C8